MKKIFVIFNELKWKGTPFAFIKRKQLFIKMFDFKIKLEMCKWSVVTKSMMGHKTQNTFLPHPRLFNRIVQKMEQY
jgi:hypothetical protein